jgi:5'(3')-deoxyribonucleotidase
VADYELSMDCAMSMIAAPDERNWAGVYGKDLPLHIQRRRKLIQQRPGFWRELSRIRLGFEVVDVLREHLFALHVLTKGPSTTPNAWTEKFEWCRKHLPDALVTVGQDKSIVYGRILVDDFPEYFLPWLDHRPRGLVVAIQHPWNENIRHANLVHYDGTNLEYVRERIAEQASRTT